MILVGIREKFAEIQSPIAIGVIDRIRALVILIVIVIVIVGFAGVENPIMIVIQEGLAPGIAAIAIAVAEGFAWIVLAIAEGHFEHAGGQDVLAEDFGLGGAGPQTGDDGIIIGREIGTVGSQDVLPECLDIREKHGRTGQNRTDSHVLLKPPVFPGNPVAWVVQVPVAGLHRP